MSIIQFSTLVAFTFFFSTNEEKKNNDIELNHSLILYLSDTIPQGKMKYELYFSEWNGRMNNLKVDIIIQGNKITVFNNTEKPLPGGKILVKGILMKHKSGKWIIGKNNNDKNAEEIGGCTNGPIIIDFKTKIIEWC